MKSVADGQNPSSGPLSNRGRAKFDGGFEGGFGTPPLKGLDLGGGTVRQREADIEKIAAEKREQNTQKAQKTKCQNERVISVRSDQISNKNYNE